MINRPITEPALKHALLKKGREIISDTGWPVESREQKNKTKSEKGPDVIFLLRHQGDAQINLWINVKNDMRPCAFETWARHHSPTVSDKHTVPILAVPSMSERLADLCRQFGWSWFDLAGNCRIDVPGLLYIERSGIPPVFRRPRARANLGTNAAARVVRALLAPAHAGYIWQHRNLLNKTYRHNIPGDYPVSIGLVNKVVRYLRDEGFAEHLNKKGIRIKDPKGLLDAWDKAYRFDRHERRNYFTLIKGVDLARALDETRLETANKTAYASFSAAERQAPHVRQGKTWVYVDAQYLDILEQHTKATSVDSGENLIVLVPEDLGVFVSFDNNTPQTTDPVQTYVDLRHSGGRGEEAAQAILEQKLLPAWKAGGITKRRT